jgi:hypothetical protein
LARPVVDATAGVELVVELRENALIRSKVLDLLEPQVAQDIEITEQSLAPVRAVDLADPARYSPSYWAALEVTICNNRN